MDASVDQAPRHPIRVVARRTGLSAEVIRAWENRFQVVEPDRTASGRRLYTESQIAHLALLRKVIQAGHSIGQVAALTPAALARLVEPGRPDVEGSIPAGASVVDDAVAAVERMDGAALELRLRAAALVLAPSDLIEQVLVPLMRRIGDAWHAEQMTVGHEHLASSIVRSVIATLPRPIGLPASAPAMVVAAPAGQMHEIGALVVSAAAATDGWRIAYLGANTPAADIVRTARQVGAAIVAVSITIGHDPALASELTALRIGLPSVTILAGGRAVDQYADLLATVGAVVLADTHALRATLGRRAGAA